MALAWSLILSSSSLLLHSPLLSRGAVCVHNRDGVLWVCREGPKRTASVGVEELEGVADLLNLLLREARALMRLGFGGRCRGPGPACGGLHWKKESGGWACGVRAGGS
jgi:hypothetical protein